MSVSNRPPARTATSRSSSVAVSQKTKGKGKQTKPSPPSPPPEPVHQIAEETQAEGPLGAPSLTTHDPQILLEEAEDEIEDESDIEVAATLDGTGRWDEAVPAQNMRGPHYGVDGADEFQNVWGRS